MAAPSHRHEDRVPSSGVTEDGRVSAFVDRCRVVATELPALESAGRFDALTAVLRQVPSDCRSPAARATVVAMVAELAGRVLSGADSGARPEAAAVAGCIPAGCHPHVEHALALLARRATDPAITLQIVADAVGVSRWHLSRLLRSWTGLSFLGLLAALRIREAKRLLIESSLSVKEVAARCGYEHVSHFDRQFRRQCGMTPGTYRALWSTSPSGRAAPAGAGKTA